MSESDDGKAPENESKADKFRRIGKRRLTAAIEKIALLENLGSSGYEFTQEQADKVIHHLTEAVSKVKTSLDARLKKSGTAAGGTEVDL
jgi:hypothetical protein